MDGIEVDRLKLIDTLKTNREAHIKEFEEAMDGYRVLAITKMKENLESAVAGREIERYIDVLAAPESHEKDYDDVLGLLEMGTTTSVKLDARSYKMYVKDEWAWTNNFKMSHHAYSSSR